MDSVILDEIIKKVKMLPDNLQRQVLIFVDTLQASSVCRTQDKALLEFTGAFSPDELSPMGQTIEAGCEQADGSDLTVEYW